MEDTVRGTRPDVGSSHHLLRQGTESIPPVHSVDKAYVIVSGCAVWARNFENSNSGVLQIPSRGWNGHRSLQSTIIKVVELS